MNFFINKKKALPLAEHRGIIQFEGFRKMWLEQTAWVWMPAIVAFGAVLTWQNLRLGWQVRDLQRRLNRIDPRRKATVRHLRRVA